MQKHNFSYHSATGQIGPRPPSYWGP